MVKNINRNRNHSKLISPINTRFLLFLLLVTVGCTQSEPTNTEKDNANDDATQVVLKTQLGPFILEEKSEVKSKYETQSIIKVPDDLAPQNKWVMFEGPVLENKLIAYRFYLDSRHRSDIFGKKTHSLVMDTVSWAYHDIMDWGSDILKVGQSLGIGAPAILYADSLYTLSNCAEKTVAVVHASGPEAAVKFTFKDLKIGDETRTITQLWSIGAKRPHTKVVLEVENGELPEGAHFATGIVKHLHEAESGFDEDRFFLFSWGEQSFHKQNLGMGIVAMREFSPIVQKHPLNHLVVFEKSKTGVEYEFAAAWEADIMSIKTAEAFKKALLK